MQHFEVATFDQILIYNGQTFTSQDNNMTLAELEIEPETTLILKVRSIRMRKKEKMA